MLTYLKQNRITITFTNRFNELFKLLRLSNLEKEPTIRKLDPRACAQLPPDIPQSPLDYYSQLIQTINFVVCHSRERRWSALKTLLRNTPRNTINGSMDERNGKMINPFHRHRSFSLSSGTRLFLLVAGDN